MVRVELCKNLCEKNILTYVWRLFNDYLLFKVGLALFFQANSQSFVDKLLTPSKIKTFFLLDYFKEHLPSFLDFIELYIQRPNLYVYKYFVYEYFVYIGFDL